MTNDVAVFLDLDNLVIGAKQANLHFDINLILDHIKKMTNGRIVMRRSYGDWRQSRDQLKDLATAGFTTQSTVRINNFSKNLADMQIVVDAMDTLVDGHQYNTYVLMTGDRDFTPLVQSLRKRGKQVIGVGVKHTASSSFVALCDRYIFYEDVVPTPSLDEAKVRDLLKRALQELEEKHQEVRASVLKQHMNELSNGAFDNSRFGEGNFSAFLEQHPDLVQTKMVDTTMYAHSPQRRQPESDRALHLRYRTALKKQKLRVIDPTQRITILRDVIKTLRQEPDKQWRPLIDQLYETYQGEGREEMSKNAINSVLLVAREADVIDPQKDQSLAQAPVRLCLNGQKIVQEAILRCDKTYLRALTQLDDEPFVMEAATEALYDSPKYQPYIQTLLRRLEQEETKE